MLFTSEPTKKEFDIRMDEYGDSYTSPMEDVESLKEVTELHIA